MNREALKRVAVLSVLFLGICVASILTMFAAAWASVSIDSSGHAAPLARLAFAISVAVAVLSILRKERPPLHESQPG